MKLEDIKTDEDLQAYVEKSAEAAVDGLKNKNSELMGKLKSAAENAAPDNIDSLISDANELKKLKESSMEEQGEYKKLLETAREQHEKDINELNEKLDKSVNYTKKLLVQDGLTKELSRNNVNPVLLEPAIMLLSDKVSVIDGDDGGKIARIGDRTLTEYVKEWAGSDVGKNFVLASSNSGGGAGGNGGTGTQSESEKHFLSATWNLTEQAKLSKTDPDLYASLQKKHPTREASSQQS